MLNKNKNQNKKWKNEQGLALVIAICITSALVAIGSFAMVMTNTELDISRNDRLSKEAFFAADAGNPISTKVLEDIISQEAVPSYAGFDFSDNFLNEVRNYYDPEQEENLNDQLVDSTRDSPDIETTLFDKEISIDVDWRYRKSGAGGSLLFAMGYESVGADRSHGGVKVYYDIEAKGKVFKNIIAEIGSVYVSQ
jgi:hypothetical protein